MTQKGDSPRRPYASCLPGSQEWLGLLASWLPQVECNLTLLTLGFQTQRHPTVKNILVSLTKVPHCAPSVPAKYHVKVSGSHSQIFLHVLTRCLPTSWLWPRMSCTADLPILIRCRSLSWGRQSQAISTAIGLLILILSVDGNTVPRMFSLSYLSLQFPTDVSGRICLALIALPYSIYHI